MCHSLAPSRPEEAQCRAAVLILTQALTGREPQQLRRVLCEYWLADVTPLTRITAKQRRRTMAVTWLMSLKLISRTRGVPWRKLAVWERWWVALTLQPCLHDVTELCLLLPVLWCGSDCCSASFFCCLKYYVYGKRCKLKSKCFLDAAIPTPLCSSLPGTNLKSGSKRGACSACRGILYAVWGGLFSSLSFKDRIVKGFVVISHVQAVKIQSGIVILFWEMNKMQFCWLLSALIFHPWFGCFSKNLIPLVSVWVAGFFFCCLFSSSYADQ